MVRMSVPRCSRCVANEWRHVLPHSSSLVTISGLFPLPSLLRTDGSTRRRLREPTADSVVIERPDGLEIALPLWRLDPLAGLQIPEARPPSLRTEALGALDALRQRAGWLQATSASTSGPSQATGAREGPGALALPASRPPLAAPPEPSRPSGSPHGAPADELLPDCLGGVRHNALRQENPHARQDESGSPPPGRRCLHPTVNRPSGPAPASKREAAVGPRRSSPGLGRRPRRAQRCRGGPQRLRPAGAPGLWPTGAGGCVRGRSARSWRAQRHGGLATTALGSTCLPSAP